MNSLIRLWNIISGLGDSLTRTKELVEAGNARIEHALGMEETPLKLVDVSMESAPIKRVKGAKEAA